MSTTLHPVPVDHAVAMAAGRDAGNASMRRAGRTAWNEDDWNAAADAVAALLAIDAGGAP